ncbi:MAG: mechanosensitive ion channel [Bacteroidales bacterium]|nr:mechanosensitive ion channel [Alloprevotella sp.]MBR1644500.1 mechanosensitive ion channel [Bacteroidales bacterium]MBR1645049.1 mechanosensitive ion channel [Bacteroidales bacterium]
MENLNVSQLDQLISQLVTMGVSAGKNILAALLLFIVGRYIVKFLNKLFARLLSRGTIDPSVQTFLRSLVNVLLILLLVVSVVSALGVNTTSFAALLASAGVAIGMALSGNLQNFAGGILILLFKPYKVGDWIEAQGQSGTVKEIQIFHTVIETADLRAVIIPNGSMSNAMVVNVSRFDMRRLIWTVSIEYGNDVDYAREVLIGLMKNEPLLLTEPKDKAGNALVPYFVELSAMNSSSIDLSVRAYCNAADYWAAFFKMQSLFYRTINEDARLNIPFQTQTLHIVKD